MGFYQISKNIFSSHYIIYTFIILITFSLSGCQVINGKKNVNISLTKNPLELDNRSVYKPDFHKYIEESKDKKIYPFLKELLTRDGKIYPGFLRSLKEVDWNFFEVDNIFFIYDPAYQESDLQMLKEEIQMTKHTLGSMLKLQREDIHPSMIYCILFSDTMWDKYMQGPSFYFRGTSQIYFELSTFTLLSSKRSTIAHELTHLILSRIYSGKIIPLWLDEGLSMSMEKRGCLMDQFLYLLKSTDILSEDKSYSILKWLVSIEIYPFNQDKFYMNSYYLVQFLMQVLGDNFFNFTKDYLNQPSLTTETFWQSYRQISKDPLEYEELESAFNSFLKKKYMFDGSRISEAGLEFPINEYDFGQIEVGDEARYTFIGTNNTSSPLNIEVTPGCGCSLVKLDKEIIGPGEKVEITILFDDVYQRGLKLENIYLWINSQQGEAMQILHLKVHVGSPFGCKVLGG